MDEDRTFLISLLESAKGADQLDESRYISLVGTLLNIDDDDLPRLAAYCDEIVQALRSCKQEKIGNRLIKGAEMIEAEQNPKRKQVLLAHYDRLLKELEGLE